MWGGDSAAGGGGGLGSSALAGYATQQYVEENYVGKPFFNDLFTIHGKEKVTIVDGGSTTETETEIIMLPNEIPSTVTTTDEETGIVTTTERTITSIEANYGFWSESFISALGLNSGGGGGGTSLNEPLLSINQAGLAAHPSASGQTIVWNGSAWVYGNAGGSGGTGTVTSVTMTVPTGFAISGSPITAAGTLALSFASGYSLPTTAKQSDWDTAFTNSHTHANKSVLDGITAQKVADWDDAIVGLNSAMDYITTLQGYFTNGVANNAARLSTVSKTMWGNTYWTSGGVPTSVGTTTNPASLSNVTNITMSGQISIGGFIIEVVDGKLKFNGDIYATGGVSALGQSSGGSGGATSLSDLVDVQLGTLANGQALVYDSTLGKWKNATIQGGGSSWNDITGKPTTLSGYGITDAYISGGTITLGNNSITPLTSAGVTGTFWGNSWTNGGSLTNTITINNGYSLSFKDTLGNAKNVVTLNSSNMFALGYGTRMAGYTTDIQGAAASSAAATATAIQLKVGLTDAGIVAMKILKDGTVHIPTSSPGLRIGDALLTYTSDGLKLSAVDGSSAMNFYSMGGVSALGSSQAGTSPVVPEPRSADNGKVLMVVNGAYALVSPTTLYTGSSAPSSSQGVNGDVYLQTS